MSDIVALKALEKRADYFSGASLSPATKRAYQSDWAHFHAFCHRWELFELPSTPETICLYLTDMADSSTAVSTIVRRCTSITAIHRAAGYDSPVKSDQVGRVLKGIRKTCGVPPEQSKAMSWDDLRLFVLQCDSLIIGLRDAAILSMGWASALRRSELVALNIGDLEISEKGIIITIRRSKTDQEGKGSKIAIPRSKGDMCPVAAVERWLLRRSESPLPPNEALFTKIGVNGRNKWWWHCGKRLAARMVSAIVKHYAKHAGFSPELYSSHSLRRGLATEAGARGVPERVISRHTRHRSIKVLRSYIEDGTIWAENPLPAIYARPSSLPGLE